jgi:iron complex outermembrane recepter protein
MSTRMKQIPFAVIQSLSFGVALMGLAASSGMSAMAQTATETPPAQKLEKIEVTGSNIKRIEGESALPVTVIKRADIERTGVTTAAQLLDRLQANSGATVNLSQGVGDAGKPGYTGASLRGLGPNNTLVLLNGRRIANYAFDGAAVDVNSIPLAAIERVEILRDGASAIYGTDAIGGVINFILRNDFRGVEGSVYVTKTDRGGGDTTKYSLTGGYGDLNTQRFNVLVSLDKEENDPIKASSRPFAATAIRPDLGVQQTSGNSIPANIRTLGGANPLAATGCAPNLGSYYLNRGGDRSDVQCRYDFTSVLDIYPPVDRQSAVVRATFQAMNELAVFGEYVYVKNKSTFASSETPVNDFLGNGPFLYPAGGRYYPAPFRLPDGTLVTPTGDLSIAWRAKDAGRRTDEAISTATRYVLGVKGTIAAWDYEAGYNKSESKVADTYIDGWLSEARLRREIATGAINVFSITGQDAAGLAALQRAKILEDVRRSKGTVESFDAKASSELTRWAAGPLNLAFGVETRKEKFDDNPLPVLSGGDVQGGGGNLPVTRADRRVSAVFGELSIPIIKDLEVQLAIRSDRYSDFGSSTNPKISIRWNPTKDLLLRSSYNTGFRAPSLPDLFQPRYFSNTAAPHNDPIRCPTGAGIGAYVDEGLECDAQFQNQLGGVNTLKPEKSRQASFGFVFEPGKDLSLSSDFFWIERKNSLQSLSDTTVFDYYAAIDPINAQGRFVRNVRAANGSCVGDDPANPTPANVVCSINYVVQVQENVGTYTLRGLDLSAAYSLGMGGWGKTKISLDGTYISKYSYQFAKGGPVTNNAGLFTADNGAVARWRHVLAFNWNMGPWGATLNQNFVLGYKDAGGARRVGSTETYDAQATWSGIKGLQLVLGVRNIMDRDPAQSAQGQTFQVGYDPRYGDPFGRLFYGKIAYSFK